MQRVLRVLIACLAMLPAPILAQAGARGDPPGPRDRSLDVRYRLTVRPREMATGTRTERAGAFQLGRQPGSTQPDSVYVPPACVGTRRCPLILTTAYFEWLFPVADRYGMIVLFPGVYAGVSPATTAVFDTTLHAVLQQFAIDPAQIAIVGRCSTGMVPMNYGDNNPDVFSRVATFTSDAGDPPIKTPERSTEYFLSDGLLDHTFGQNLGGARRLRERGYAVKHVSNFRAHDNQEEDYDFLGRWLQESWAIPDPAQRPVPYRFPGPPALTVQALAQLTAFWTRFQREPDSIMTTARRAHVREVLVPVGTAETSVLMVDMPALAAQYPTVAADLKAAGLTAEQHDRYRAALVGARIAAYSDSTQYGDALHRARAIPLDPNWMVVTNYRFLAAHPDEAQALEATGMWETP